MNTLFADGELTFEDTTTGINDVNAEAATVKGIYNLNGMKVQKPGKGIYIVDGKKKMMSTH